MMNNQELTNKIVALGVCKSREMSWHLLDSDGDTIAVFTDEKLLLNDWRVAGALMEKCLDDGKPNTMWLDWYEQPPIFQVLLSRSVIVESELLPRAIIEVCVEALSDE